MLGESVQVLARAGLGHVERVRQLGDSRVGALQPLHDLALARAELERIGRRLDVLHSWVDYRKKKLSERS